MIAQLPEAAAKAASGAPGETRYAREGVNPVAPLWVDLPGQRRVMIPRFPPLEPVPNQALAEPRGQPVPHSRAVEGAEGLGVAYGARSLTQATPAGGSVMAPSSTAPLPLRAPTTPSSRITIGRIEVQVTDPPAPPSGSPAPAPSVTTLRDGLNARFLGRFVLRP